MASFSTLDWLVLSAYFSGTFFIGFLAHKQSRSASSFTTANGKLGGVLVGLSIFATYLSSISYLALPGKSFDSNWGAFVFSFSLPFAAWVAITYFLPYYRKNNAISAYSLLENRFGLWARMYGSFFYLLTQVARIGAVTYLMALPLHVLAGVDITLIIFFIGFITILYSLLGGIVAVIWTDAFQSIVLIIGAIACIGIMIFKLPISLSESLTLLSTHQKLSLGDFGLHWDQPTFWVILMYGFFTNLQNFGIDQSYVQRYVTAKNENEAKKSVWIGALLYIPVSALLFLVGTLLFLWYQTHPQQLAELQALGLSGDKVFPHFIGTQLPPGIVGLVIAAILSAGMSSVSTSLNSSATLILEDYFLRFRTHPTTEKLKLTVLYIATCFFGCMGSLVAIYMINIKSALDIWWMLSSIFSGGIVGLFLLGMINQHLHKIYALIAVVMGLIFISWMSFSLTPWWPQDWIAFKSSFHSYLIIVFGTSFIVATGTGLNALAPKKISRPLKTLSNL